MKLYIFFNSTDNERFKLFFKNLDQARKFVINHLDLTKSWKVAINLTERKLDQ